VTARRTSVRTDEIPLSVDELCSRFNSCGSLAGL
jgi:hypothetical protein